jgi:hypothetical protein
MKQKIEVVRYLKNQDGDLHLLLYDDTLIAYLYSEHNNFVQGNYSLVVDSRQTPLFKTYSIRYKWFTYNGFLSMSNEVNFHLGNRNIGKDNCFVFGSSPTDIMTTPQVTNGEKVMKWFYDMFYPQIEKGVLTVECIFRSIV